MHDLTRDIVYRRAAYGRWQVVSESPGAGFIVLKDDRPMLVSGLEHDLNQAFELTADFNKDEFAALCGVFAQGNPEATALAIAEAWWERFGSKGGA